MALITILQLSINETVLRTYGWKVTPWEKNQYVPEYYVSHLPHTITLGKSKQARSKDLFRGVARWNQFSDTSIQKPTSVLAWRIPGTGEPGGLPSIGLHRVGHDWSDSAAAAAFRKHTIYIITGLLKHKMFNT